MTMDRRSFLQTSAALSLCGMAEGPVVAASPEPDSTARSGKDFTIWDMHCHFSGVSGETPRERAEQILQYADRLGIERLVFFMGIPFVTDPGPDELRRQNDQVLDVLRRWPDRVLGFAYVNPNHPEHSVQEIDRCIAGGPMVGIKLWVARRCADELIDPIIRRAGELKAAIFQHTWWKATGNLEGESTPMDLARLAARHPTIPIICGHAGGDWTRGIRAVRACPNVSIGISGSDPTAGFVEMAVRVLGAGRVIYGSDAGGRSFASQLAKVYGAEIPDADKQAILATNLQRLLADQLSLKEGQK
jgi:hypothetical protein